MTYKWLTIKRFRCHYAVTHTGNLLCKTHTKCNTLRPPAVLCRARILQKRPNNNLISASCFHFLSAPCLTSSVESVALCLISINSSTWHRVQAERAQLLFYQRSALDSDAGRGHGSDRISRGEERRQSRETERRLNGLPQWLFSSLYIVLPWSQPKMSENIIYCTNKKKLNNLKSVITFDLKTRFLDSMRRFIFIMF